MGLSLKNLGKKIYDQVNMGDNGKTWSNDNVAINARQTTQPNPYVQQAIQNARYGVLANNKAKQQQFLGSLTVKQPNTLDHLGSAAQDAGTGLGLGGVRSLTGFGQGLSGIYDLATPGTGTNRLSKGLDKFAKFTDETAKNEGVGASYKVGQFGTDALTFLAGGAVAKGISKAPVVAKVTSPASKVVAPISSTLDKGIAKVAVKGTGGRIAAKGLQATKSVPNLANTATFSGYDIGQRASKGQDISGKDVAFSVGSNLAMNAGLPMLGQAAKEVPGAFRNVANDTATNTMKAADVIDNKILKDKATVQINQAINDASKAAEADMKRGASRSTLAGHRRNLEDLYQQRNKINQDGSIGLSRGTLEDKAAEMAQAQAQKEKLDLGYTGLEKARSKGRAVSSQIFNPYSEAERFNAQVAKSLGVARKDLNAKDDLAHLLDTTSNSGVYAQDIAEKSGLQNVIGRHKPGSQEEANFITYMAMKRDLNVRGIKKNVQILPYETKDMAQAVADYEKRNPEAIKDLGVVNSHFKTILENARKAGTITDEAYKKALASEDYYAPVAKILGSEDVLRPTINANSKGSLSRQTALQTLTGSGADRPLNTTWDAVVQATTTTTRENARNTAFNLMYDAADKQLADNMVRMGMSKEQSKALMDLRQAILTLQDDSKTAKRLVKTASRQTRADAKKATAFNNKTQDRAIKRIADSMEKTDPDGAAALRGLGRKDQRQIATWLQEGMTEAQINKGIKVNAKAQESYSRLMSAREEAEGLIDQTKLASKEARGLQLVKNEKTGRQVLNGFVDGYPVWIETTPEMAKMVQGLEAKDLPKAIKALSGVQHVWRTFWTGIFNPVFSIKSKLFYDPAMMGINQPGSRNQLRPGVMGNSLADNFGSLDDFFTKLKPYGVAPVTGSRMMGDVKQSAQQMASHADFQSRLGYFAKHPSEALQAMDVMGGKLQHGSRMQAARSAYARAKSAKLPEEDALANAARAYNNVLPNYGRTSSVLRTIDAFIPYSNAGIAGTRAMVGGFQKDKVGFTAKAGAFATALAAVGSYALTDDTTKEFYQDMYDTNKQSILQNNLVIALPGAHKDPQTGEWTGIVKVPIPPEFRAPNAVIQDANFKANGGEANGYNPTVGATTTLATGGIANIGRDGGVNVETNPAYNSALELMTNKRNSGLGDPFAYGDTQYLPRNEQINKDTSQLAISGAQAFNKLPIGDISPAALDQQFKSFGSGGKIVRSVGSGLTANENTKPDQLPGTDLKKSVFSVVSADGTKGMTEATWHFKNQDQIRDSLKTQDLKNGFDKLNSKNDTPGDAGQKAGLLFESLQTDGTLWEAQKKQNKLDVEKGGISNPLFDLTPTQARAVMLYRSNSRLNAAKQTYAKDGSSLYQSLGLDEKWYQDFRDKENAFYKKIDEKKKAKGDKQSDSNVATAAKTYSGNVYEETSPVIKSKLDAYYKLPKGTGERSAFLKANPDIIQYWDKQTGLANEERIAMGLDLLGDGATNSFNKFGKSGGSSGSDSYVGSAYKYAVSTQGSVPKSKVTAKSAGSAKIAKKPITKPKVTIKKSLV